METTKTEFECYRLFERGTNEPQGVYSRGYRDVFDFSSVSDARGSNCSDCYQDKKKYRVAKYKVTYTLIDEDVK